MSITVIYSREETDHSFSLTKNKFLFISLLFASLLVCCAWFIQAHYQSELKQFKTTTLHDRDISKDQYLQLIKAQSDEQLTVLANKVGNLQAQINRLNALGQRVIEQSNLPKKEFDFESALSMGGAAMQESDVDFQFGSLLTHIENLDDNFKKKQKQLIHLEIALNNLHLIDQLYISGRPTKGKGSWLSSPFGTRKDPFSGRLTRHKGVDFAGFIGMPIISTAAGVVTESGKRGGYGRMVEIEHGNGLVTRYAHTKSVNVAIGDVVKKGQIIAIMGNSGRSTGPHVHYEVLKNGKQINPNYYLLRKAG
ncbi:MAG: murein DD-endopeptidase MepM/ murein hydrolase activator NlpD [Psychromonas sp.]|jgi:murein DD-endopeptidase MepM/ murein hydrolase activator NlpD|uniref:M23 family metallopeptidase n=1 Tax=Psychromonas sp. TaxID=1884585 RepID=UPI0039E6ABBF